MVHELYGLYQILTLASTALGIMLPTSHLDSDMLVPHVHAQLDLAVLH